MTLLQAKAMDVDATRKMFEVMSGPFALTTCEIPSDEEPPAFKPMFQQNHHIFGTNDACSIHDFFSEVNTVTGDSALTDFDFVITV